MSEHLEHGDDVSVLAPQLEVEPPREEDGHCPLPFRLQLIDDLSYEDVKKCYRGSTVSKYNSQYHKLFQTVPKEEILMKVYSCALLRDILLQGRLYISRNWLCFYANLFGKDIKRSCRPGVYTCGVGAAGEETQDGRVGAQRPGHHHGHRPEVRLRVAAVQRQRLRRPEEDLHSPAGEREESECEAVPGGAGQLSLHGRVPGGVEVEEEAVASRRLLIPSGPAGRLHPQPRCRHALQLTHALQFTHPHRQQFGAREDPPDRSGA
ncbi:uncharacterized protein gramd2ab isoform X6 [Nelusetta ayraudi]|uniref:uncharacterized protein gramd2ab isoform X6 n=1 Tax=Nelusetta ayraudi TaxID=303726 RepID=UPI003F7169FA